jgi:soluble lytic murein transglycosylase-like protein
MRNRQHSYVHRGDRERRNNRIKKAALVLLFVAAAALVPRAQPQDANASASTFSLGLDGEARRLRGELDAAKGELELANAQLDRAREIINYSAHYKVAADVAASIYDVALAEGIEPDLAFRLVRVESEFNERATSPVGAIGLTQLMPATAKYFDKTVTRERLYDRSTNLRLGFRYLRALIREYNGDVKLALLVYNRGPVTVESMRALGLDPGNGYPEAVTKGYTGKGTVE